MSELIKRHIEDFYSQHEKQILVSHPGLSQQRLCDDICDYINPYLISALDEWAILPKVKFALAQILSGIPIQYVVAQTYFYDGLFYVDSEVLIPRFETEILVEEAVKFARKLTRSKDDVLQIADVGTGSGCILLSFLKAMSSRCEAMALDISMPALEVAKKNYRRYRYNIQCETKIVFVQNDRLEGISRQFDLILSNPPYIKMEMDKELVHKNVAKYEPHQALFIGDSNYQDWFIKFFNQVKECLLPRGLFIMEGHERHLEELFQLALQLGFEGEILKDYNNQNRFLKLVHSTRK